MKAEASLAYASTCSIAGYVSIIRCVFANTIRSNISCIGPFVFGQYTLTFGSHNSNRIKKITKPWHVLAQFGLSTRSFENHNVNLM